MKRSIYACLTIIMFSFFCVFGMEKSREKKRLVSRIKSFSNVMQSKKATKLEEAAGNPEKIDQFVKLLQKNPNLTDAYKASLLGIAAKHRNFVGTQYLVGTMGVSPDYPDEKTGYTPLMAAVEGEKRQDSQTQSSGNCIIDHTAPYFHPTQETVDVVSVMVPFSRSDNLHRKDGENKSVLDRAQARKMTVGGYHMVSNTDGNALEHMDNVITLINKKTGAISVAQADRLARVLSGGNLQEKHNPTDMTKCGPFSSDIAKLIAAERYSLNAQERKMLFSEQLEERKQEVEAKPASMDFLIPPSKGKVRTTGATLGDEK